MGKSMRLVLSTTMLLAIAVAFSREAAQAATVRTWLGASGNNWSTAANWNPAGAPMIGDTLVFPSTATNHTTSNDIPNLAIASLQTSGDYTISGLAFTVDTAISVGAGTVAVSAPLMAGGDVTITAAKWSFLSMAAQPTSIDLGVHVLAVEGEGQVTVTGAVSGTGALAVSGGGTLVLAGSASHTGGTTVTGGILALDGGSTPSGGSVSVSGGGAFGGGGATGRLTLADALLFPGVRGTAGIITTPRLTLGNQSTARFQLIPGSGGGYDSVTVNGPVELGNATLQLRWASEPTVGSQYRIITGATSVSGTFLGLPEGSAFTMGGRRFSITYAAASEAGPGKDIVVTRLPAEPVDLGITIAASPSYPPGGDVTVTVSVTNRGPGEARGVVMSSALPSGLGFQAIATEAGFSCARPLTGEPGIITCRGGTLAAGRTATFTIRARLAAGTTGTMEVGAAVSSEANETASADNSTTASFSVVAGARPYAAIIPMVARDGP